MSDTPDSDFDVEAYKQQLDLRKEAEVEAIRSEWQQVADDENDDLRSEARRKVRGMLADALDTIEHIMEHEVDNKIRLSAAKLVLDHGFAESKGKAAEDLASWAQRISQTTESTD